ncbi:MAG: nitrate- and nitrite sensing domain-containing protein [Labedaea sp.]
MSSIGGAASGAAGGRPAWWTTAAQWRNWPLLVKLSMVLVVPVVGALVLGVLRVNADVNLANSYADIGRIAALRSELVPTLSAIQRERNIAMQTPANGSDDFTSAIVETDSIIARTNRLVQTIPDLGQAAAQGYRELGPAFEGLSAQRELVRSAGEPGSVLSGYNVVINAVLNFDRGLVGRFPDRELSGLSTALNDLQFAREQVSLQHAIGLVAIKRGQLQSYYADKLTEANVRLIDRLTDTQVVAPADLWDRYVSIVSGPDVDRRSALVDVARQTAVLPANPVEWNATNNTTAGLMANVARNNAAQLQAASDSLQDSVSNRAGAQAVLLLIMVLLAGGIGGFLGRYLLRSFGLLRRTALDVAHNELPAAVASIRSGEAPNVTVAPVPVHTTEEFGQLARAFDAVHSQAVRSAAEEAGLRSNMRNIFVNLSRRSQGLVERQLRLMEQLEQKEDDPDQLANLFRLDHLATRMRRNNENLMVLSGMELGRRSGEPVALPDVLRAAVSEVEHYQRTVVRSAPMLRIVGYAAGDLIRSVAELVENATAFSPPTSEVIISSRQVEDGTVFIDILDQGIGMGEAELIDANQRVAAGGGVDVPVSRQMGLFVVGSLTARHGIQVRLARRDDAPSGLRATVLVPRELVRSGSDAGPVPATTAEPSRPTVPSREFQPPPEFQRAGETVRIAEPGRHAEPVRRAEPVRAEWVRPLEPVRVPEQASAPAAPVVFAAPRPVAVHGLLESAGIYVRLPELPAASSPASILFAARTPVEETTGAGGDSGTGFGTGSASAAAAKTADFAWLGKAAQRAKHSEQPAAPKPQVAPAAGPDGLPKRIPQAQLISPKPGGGRATAPPATGGRDASRARGLLSNFQAGIRRTESDKGEQNS